DLQPVLLEDAQAVGDVVVVVPAAGVQVLGGDRDLQAVVAPGGRMRGDLLEREIAPLSGEQGVRMSHGGGAPSGDEVGSQRVTVAPSAASEAMIASSTRCSVRPSAKSGEKPAPAPSVPSPIAASRSRAWFENAFSQPSTWPCGHQASRYG